MPLRERRTPPRTTSHTTSPSTIAVDAQHDRAVGEEDVVAGPDPARRARAASSRRGARRRRSAVDVSVSSAPVSSWISSSTTGPVRIFGPGRSTSTPTARPSAAAVSRASAARSRVDVGGSVRGVQANDVGARREQRAHRLRRRRRGADGRDDLRAPHTPGLSRGLASGRGPHPHLRHARAGRARRAARGTGAPATVRGRHRAARSTSRAAGESDELDDTVDYGAVCDAVSRVVASEQYQLLERLATRIAEVCRADPRVVGRRRRGAQAASAGARAARPRRACASSGDAARTSRSARISATGCASPVRGRRARRGRRRRRRRGVARVRDRAGRRPAAGRVPERGRRGRHRARSARAARARATDRARRAPRARRTLGSAHARRRRAPVRRRTARRSRPHRAAPADVGARLRARAAARRRARARRRRRRRGKASAKRR